MLLISQKIPGGKNLRKGFVDMPESDMKALMASSSSLPKFPVPSEERLREMLIEQILSFQSRYEFLGARLTKESLDLKTNTYLERLCNMQILGITLSRARDTLLNK